MNNKSRIHKGCDSTGLRACACLWHDCYCPGGVVDFQKGERCFNCLTAKPILIKTGQMNIDYVFYEALKNTGAKGAPCCIVMYDVNCQYFKNF